MSIQYLQYLYHLSVSSLEEIMSNSFANEVVTNPFLCIICFKSFPEKLKLTSHTLHCIKSVHNEALNPVSHENDQIQTVCEDVDDITSQNKMNCKDDAHFNSPKASIHERDKPFQCNECDSCFARSSQLTVHVTSVHERKKAFSMQCVYCL